MSVFPVQIIYRIVSYRIGLCLSVSVCLSVGQFKMTLAHDGSGQGAALVAATATRQTNDNNTSSTLVNCS